MPATNKAFLFALFITLLLGFHPLSHALSISDIQLNSRLNQRLDAHIPFLSVSPKEIENLKVGIIYDETVTNIYRQPKIRVEVVTGSTGNHYLHVKSDEPLKEPILNFTLELSWSTGRLNREYKLLIDPELG